MQRAVASQRGHDLLRVGTWLLVAGVAVAVASLAVPEAHRNDLTPSARAIVLTSTAALSGLLHQAWRATGSAVIGRAAVSSTLLVLVALVDVVAAVLPDDAVSAFRAAASLAAAWWITRAATGTEVDTTLQPVRHRLRTTAVVLAAGAVLAASLSVAATGSTAVAALPALGWAGALLHVTAATYRRPGLLPPWLTVVVGTLTLAEVARLVPGLRTVDLSLVATSMHGIALLLAITAVGHLLLTTATAARDAAYLQSATHQSRSRAAAESARARRHDLGNAVAAVEVATVTLGHDDPSLDPAVRSQVQQAVQDELAQIRLLLAKSEPAGPELLRADTVDLDHLAEQQALLTHAGGHLISVHGDAAEASADPVAVARILRNLLANAIRHGADRAEQTQIEVYLAADDTTATVTVRDHGAGIAEADQDFIFVPGWRGRPGGEGLGLHVAHRLAREQGGDLRLVEVAGRGAAFELRLPRRTPGVLVATDDPQHRGDVRDVVPSPVPAEHDASSPGAVSRV